MAMLLPCGWRWLLGPAVLPGVYGDAPAPVDTPGAGAPRPRPRRRARKRAEARQDAGLVGPSAPVETPGSSATWLPAPPRGLLAEIVAQAVHAYRLPAALACAPATAETTGHWQGHRSVRWPPRSRRHRAPRAADAAAAPGRCWTGDGRGR